MLEGLKVRSKDRQVVYTSIRYKGLLGLPEWVFGARLGRTFQ